MYTLGTILSMQISFVGFQPVQSSEHMAVSQLPHSTLPGALSVHPHHTPLPTPPPLYHHHTPPLSSSSPYLYHIHLLHCTLIAPSPHTPSNSSPTAPSQFPLHRTSPSAPSPHSHCTLTAPSSHTPPSSSSTAPSQFSLHRTSPSHPPHHTLTTPSPHSPPSLLLHSCTIRLVLIIEN